MTINSKKADDDIDALEALASEEKEFNKVRPRTPARVVAQSLIVWRVYRMQKLIVF